MVCPTAEDALRTLLRSLGQCVPAPVGALADAYRAATAGLRLLLVLDDVRDPAQVRPLLPGSADSLVLVTSRRPLTGLAASGGAALVEIERPSRAEAREMLTAHLGGEGDPARLDELAERCGRLPRALAAAVGQDRR